MVMRNTRMLTHKMLREIKENKGVYLACIVVIAIGLMVFSSMSVVLENLEAAKARFYEEYHFADGFIQVAGMPENRVKRLESIPGIKQVEGRITKDVKVLTEDPAESVFLRLVSLNEAGEGQRLNDIHLTSGGFTGSRVKEVVIDPQFLSARNLQVGESLNIVYGGKASELVIVGSAQSPEFIYAMRKAQDILPDPESFGIAYVPLEQLQELIKENQINDIAFTLDSGVEFNQVKPLLEDELKPYGLKGIIPRNQQTSEVILSQEIEGLKATVKSLPIVFLGVASIILYTMLRRLIEQQRMAIGTLKAFGFSGREIVVHYLSYPIFIGVIGGLLGGLSGLALAFPLTATYRQFFALPGLESTWSLKYLAFSIMFALIFSVLSGLKSSLDILKLNPSEAMRPPAPPSARKLWIERFESFWERLNVQSQMGIRNISRNKVRSLFTMVGIGFIFSLMTVSWALKDMSDLMMLYQFEKVQRYDVKMAFERPLPARDIERTLAHEPGVQTIEPLLEVPVTLKNQWLKKDVAIIGLVQDSTLYRILDDKGREIPVPEEGVVLSKRLAELLQVRSGDRVYIESPLKKEVLGEAEGDYVEVKGVVPQYVGLNAFMAQSTLQTFLGQGPISTSVILNIEQDAINDLKKKYREASEVAAIESTQESIAKFNELMGSYGYMTLILALFGGIAGFALIYNSSIIALSERQREIASLRVLGMTPREVLRVITTEQWFLSAVGILLGIPLTYLIQSGMAQAVNSDLYSMPTSLPLLSFVWAILGTAFAIIVAQYRAFKRIKALPFVDLLKTVD